MMGIEMEMIRVVALMIMKIFQRFKMEQDGPPLGVRTNFVSVPDRNVNIKFTER